MIETFADRLLAWYDRHARELPWRVGPKNKQSGTIPDPYHVWLSEIMLQQTTVATVKPYFIKFLQRWPPVDALAAADIDAVMSEWAGLGYYSRARNLHAAAQQVQSEHAGSFPKTESQLKSLKGVGDYTAAAIASIAFDQRAVVVDGNVDRVIVRHENIRDPIVDVKPEIRAHADRRTPDLRPGDYAQAMMDLGATVCTPTAPQCLLCPVREDCQGHRAGDASALPIKKPKPPKPVRRGAIKVVVSDDGHVLVQTNPASGLLGGMTVFPHSPWVDVPAAAGNAKANFVDWHMFASQHRIDGAPEGGVEVGLVRHTFTHFHLVLQVLRLDVSTSDFRSNRSRWHAIDDLDALALPTLMHKVWRLAMPA